MGERLRGMNHVWDFQTEKTTSTLKNGGRNIIKLTSRWLKLWHNIPGKDDLNWNMLGLDQESSRSVSLRLSQWMNSPSTPWCRRGQRSRWWRWRRRPWTIAPSAAWHSLGWWRRAAATAATSAATSVCYRRPLEGYTVRVSGRKTYWPDSHDFGLG